ncbi:MAG: FeoB-associated Cys-rich membrane protein [Desulfobulbus sp.]|uniref:FeoB-associated Cys-rich membrane protein n=1 Tax=Desulfobulbus sp. TaxID=895 RepID=UPI0028438CCE|nr:FeoB-associated Cys-rich membrane protein [Desulfobulbus sp.]
MQQILVILAVALAAFFTGRRLWRSWRNAGTGSCGCGCSGCDDSSRTAHNPFPMHKP